MGCDEQDDRVKRIVLCFANRFYFRSYLYEFDFPVLDLSAFTTRTSLIAAPTRLFEQAVPTSN